MNGTRHCKDQLRFGERFHLRADDQFGSRVDFEPVAQILELFLVPGDQDQAFHVTR